MNGESGTMDREITLTVTIDSHIIPLLQQTSFILALVAQLDRAPDFENRPFLSNLLHALYIELKP